MNASTNNWAVYDKDGNRVALYDEMIPPHSQFGSAQGNARRHAARLGAGYSHCQDRGPNRWEDLVTKTKEIEDFYNGADDDWSEDEDTEVEEPEFDEVNCSDNVYARRVENVKNENEILGKLGIIVPAGNYVSRGTASHGNFRLRNQAFEKLPLVSDECLTEVADVIEDENRRDYVADIDSIRMGQDGNLKFSDNGYIRDLGPIEERAFPQLLARIGVFPAVNRAFNLWPDPIMIHTFNRVMDYYSRNGRWDQSNTEHGKKQISIGTRENTKIGKRSVYRAVSTSYQGGLDCEAVLRATELAINGTTGARADISYNPSTTRAQVDILFQKGYQTESRNDWAFNPMCKGSVFQFGLRITSGDAANHRFLIQAIARRDGCDNCVMIGEDAGILVEKRHVGDLETIRQAMFGDDGAVEKTMSLVKPMLKQWGYIESVPVNSVKLWGQSFTDTDDRDEDTGATVHRSAAENAITWAVKNNKIGKGHAKKAMLDYLLSGLSKEPSPCLDGILNAITRAAHDSLLDDIVRDQLEREAGALLPVFANAAAPFVFRI